MTLDLQVATRNKVNAKANYVSTYLQSLLSNYFEKKVVKFTPYKTWTAQIKKEIEKLQQQLQDSKFRIVFNFGYGNIFAEIDTTFPVDGGGVRYVKQHFYVARFNENTGALTEISCVDSFRTDYTAQEIEEKGQKLSELSKIVSELKSELSRFY
jgi:hypothetical protein